MNQVAIVTGGTSGIGKATALALKASGCTVYEFSRRAQGVEGLHHIAADVTSEDSVRAAVAQVMDAEGRIDILVNNAGFGISGAIEFTSTADAKSLFDVNFFGMVNMNRAVIPIMRQAGRGRIVNLSSVAAPVPIPFQAYYSATKASVNAYAMALANELRPFGITVCAVMPGDIHTGFTAARRKVSEGDDIYGGRISRSVARMEHDEQDRHGSRQGGRLHCQGRAQGALAPPALRHPRRLQVFRFSLQDPSGAGAQPPDLRHLRQMTAAGSPAQNAHEAGTDRVPASFFLRRAKPRDRLPLDFY